MPDMRQSPDGGSEFPQAKVPEVRFYVGLLGVSVEDRRSGPEAHKEKRGRLTMLPDVLREELDVVF